MKVLSLRDDAGIVRLCPNRARTRNTMAETTEEYEAVVEPASEAKKAGPKPTSASRAPSVLESTGDEHIQIRHQGTAGRTGTFPFGLNHASNLTCCFMLYDVL